MDFTNQLKSHIGSRAKWHLVPMSYLEVLNKDLDEFVEKHTLDQFQTWTVNTVSTRNVPELPFQAKSLLVMAIPFALRRCEFMWRGKIGKDLLCAIDPALADDVANFIESAGFHAALAPALPQKRLATSVGLSAYGRNGITFEKEWGSFFDIITLFTDIPEQSDFCWQAPGRSDLCEHCSLCVGNCPTGALQLDRFLMETSKCLSFYNELPGKFPKWLPKSVHHSVMGCYRCQEICPQNAQVLSAQMETLVFSEAETKKLLSGCASHELPESVQQKLLTLGVEDWCYQNMARNLKALLRNA